MCLMILAFGLAALVIPSQRAASKPSGPSALPGRLGILTLATTSASLVAIYLYRISFYISCPADLLMWSESHFINDILKLRLGLPIYAAPQDSSSYFYTPGSQILTYLIAVVFGQPTSIPFYRIVQLGYASLASLVAVACCVRLRALSSPAAESRCPGLWIAFWLPSLFLIAVNPVTNKYNFALHNDALALLLATIAYWLLLKYESTRNNWLLAPMALMPAIGFLVKQNLAVLAPLYVLYLILHQPRAIRRAMVFAAATLLSLAGVFGACYLLWGDPFIFWCVTVLGARSVSVVQALYHIMQAWLFAAFGLFGGWMLLRSGYFKRLSPAWLFWLLLFLGEAYTSGIGFNTNQLGPASLIGGIWFLAGLAKVWPEYSGESGRLSSPAEHWLRRGMAVGTTGLLFAGIGAVQPPLKPVSSDLARYLEEIEGEFSGVPADRVLLDQGTWIYARRGIVMRDRAGAIFEQGFSGMNYYGTMLQRIEEKYYAKIIVRNFDNKYFWYDWFDWPKPSGIRAALLENYREVRRIKGVAGSVWPQPALISELTVLEPNAE